MTLFAALASNADAVPSASCTPPTALQLHTSRRAFDFSDNTIADDISTCRHSILSFQAVQTQRDDDNVASSHDKPDLGIWNCCVSNGYDDVSLGGVVKRVLLRRATDEEKKEHDDVVGDTDTVVMTLDLEGSNEVHPTLERMRNVVANAYDGGADGRSDAGKRRIGRTTSIASLRSCRFGEAQAQEFDGAGKKIALILAVIVPSSAERTDASSEYKRRQSRSLVMYHLHKFAMEVNCTLCFVRGGVVDAVESDNSSSISTVTVEEMSALIRRVAVGLSPLDEASFAVTDGEDGRSNDESADDASVAKTTVNPSVYPPGSHDAELIRGALMRNASCEGGWDASEDDLHVALPPPVLTSTVEETKESTIGEDEWLSKLESSVGISIDASSAATNYASGGIAEVTTPVERKRETLSKKKKSSKVVASSGSNSEKDPSDFFANLLKK